jgi:hypothetical protein
MSHNKDEVLFGGDRILVANIVQGAALQEGD